jgi:hypothetical protein
MAGLSPGPNADAEKHFPFPNFVHFSLLKL